MSYHERGISHDNAVGLTARVSSLNKRLFILDPLLLSHSSASGDLSKFTSIGVSRQNRPWYHGSAMVDIPWSNQGSPWSYHVQLWFYHGSAIGVILWSNQGSPWSYHVQLWFYHGEAWFNHGTTVVHTRLYHGQKPWFDPSRFKFNHGSTTMVEP